MSEPRDRGRPTIPEAFDPTSLFPADRGERPVLVVLTGPQVGQRVRLDDAALIGRDPEADLMLTDPSVEWHHARVEPDEHGWTVVDLTGQRRTEVNGMRVTELLLSPDDQIIIGGTVVRYELHDPIEQAYDEVILERLNKDDLTGLLARRKFDAELISAIERATRCGEPLALLVLDLDGLKAINDRHGHLVGARVIGDVGRLIGAVLGDRGLACRLGGDEFGVVLPGRDGAAGCGVAEEVRAEVASRVFEHDGERLSVRISAGVAALTTHGHAPLALLRAADEALYRAKRAGGDRVELR